MQVQRLFLLLLIALIEAVPVAAGNKRGADRHKTFARACTSRSVGPPGGGMQGGRWIVGVSTACNSSSALQHVEQLISAYPSLAVVMNIHDAKSESGCRLARGLYASSFQPGMKGLFWKKVMTPSMVSPFDLVWLIDSDIWMEPRLFQLEAVVQWINQTGAEIVQPALIARKGFDRSKHRMRAFSADCVVSTVTAVEQGTPIFRRRAYVSFWETLHAVPDKLLTSDVGLADLWCGVARVQLRNPHACAVIFSVQAIHTDTHAIEAANGGKQAANALVRKGGPGANALTSHLYHHFGSMMADRHYRWSWEPSSQRSVALDFATVSASDAIQSSFCDACWDVNVGASNTALGG